MASSKARAARGDLERELDDLEGSGLTVAAYARERGLAPWRLYEGRRRRARRRGASRGAAAELLPVVVKDEADGPGVLEVELHGGRRIRVPSGFDERGLRRLVLTLESC